MNVLLTGAAGFIGSHVAVKLLGLGHEVTGFDVFDTTLYDTATHERNVAFLRGRPGFTLVRGDIVDHKTISDVMHGKDLVVHLAALAGVRPSIAQPERYARVNVEGTISVLEACRKVGVKRLVFASSSSVYGAHAKAPFSEEDPCLSPASPYAATKRAGELLCSNWRDLHGIGVTSLRYFTVYGPRQRPEMAIHRFARAILDDKPITLYGDGSSARDYTYIDDIVEGTLSACRLVKPGELKIYNLGGAKTTTLKELVDLISKKIGKVAQIEWQPDQPGDVPLTSADVSRAQRELAYQPHVPIEEGIGRFVDWLREV